MSHTSSSGRATRLRSHLVARSRHAGDAARAATTGTMRRVPRGGVAGALLALGLLVPTSAAHAQRIDVLPAGARVRVYPRVRPPLVVQGTVVRADSGVLTLAVGRRRTTRELAAGDIHRIEQLVGRRSVGSALGRGALRGALVGAGIGVLATGITAVAERRDPCDECFIPMTAAVGAASVAFTMATTAVGGVVGLLRRDRWETVPLP